MTTAPAAPTPLTHRTIGPAVFDGFVRALGTEVVDGNGVARLLRGVGLGNWMLAEGYMWKFGPGAESPREIEALTTRLIGEEGSLEFWRSFRESFITERDIERIAACGFDHVRLPINSRLIQDETGNPREEGYRLIDNLISWCRRHAVWVVLDLHGAPGGQTGTNIDDSPAGQPELFMSPQYRERTIDLWREIAHRYADETVVLGYDLLNEPLPNEWQYTYAEALPILYQDLTAAIREIDPDHLIIYEGSHWATNWSMFTEVWDGNSMLQFHKYWSSPDTESIQRFLDVRESLELPIYMGEGGENTIEWLYTAFRLYETHGIGWNFWPWKKIGTRTSPASIVPPEGWEEIVSAAHGATVDRERARNILDAVIAASALERCEWVPGIVPALMGERPIRLPAWGFGFRGPGESSRVQCVEPRAIMRPSDGVPIAFRSGAGVDNPFEQTDGRDYAESEVLVVELEAGDWLEYEARDVDTEHAVVVLDGSPVDGARITSTSRGLRVTAERPIRFDTVLLDGDESL